MAIRNKNHEKERTKHEESLNIQGFNYKSKESTPQLITESKSAKQVLSDYVFKSIFLKSYNLKRSYE